MHAPYHASMEPTAQSDISTSFQELSDLLVRTASDESFQVSVQKAADILFEKLTAGGTLFTAGNGGSAAEAQHLSAEFVGRFRRERKEFGAVALTAESSAMTAIGNDYSFDQVFARQIRALGRPGDVFVALTTSGNSSNIIEAVKDARLKGVTTICLLGKGGGIVAGVADLDIIVPSELTARIQEVHLLIIHALCESFDTRFLNTA
jgi:D-sedoheptulose 7-phosphate isomerase